MDLNQCLINAGADILPMDKVYVYDFNKALVYSNEFWRLLDDPIYEGIRKRPAVEVGWRIFYLLNDKSQEKQCI